ncbi:LysM peptidoglycan-binding domain-containing protein [Porticoccaceae bacterium]|nr:LysM peptidoglycan-binding domain-containing protein [Porticoccaceae bacterium]
MKKFRFSSALMAAVLSTTLAAALSFSNQSFSNQSFANQSVSNQSPSNPNSSSPSALINEDVPDSYTVVPGDTLWDISALFLKDPWMWPEIWHANQQIDNPHLIYPGDVISLVYINGVPQLKIVRSREVKLSPEIRSLDHGDAISALPLNVISTFLSKTRVTDNATLNGAPYVLGGAEPYLDPQTGELLGIRAIDIGAARIKALEKDVATLNVSRAEGEIRIKDRLLVAEERTLASTFYPRAPETAISGLVMNVEEGVRNAGALDLVAINRGNRDGLQSGDTLAIFKRGELVKDRVASERVRLPDERIGLLMVFDTYEKMSFALVMEADRQIDLGDLLRNP